MQIFAKEENETWGKGTIEGGKGVKFQGENKYHSRMIRFDCQGQMLRWQPSFGIQKCRALRKNYNNCMPTSCLHTLISPL